MEVVRKFSIILTIPLQFKYKAATPFVIQIDILDRKENANQYVLQSGNCMKSYRFISYRSSVSALVKQAYPLPGQPH